MNKHLIKSKRHRFLKNRIVNKKIKNQKEYIREKIEQEIKKEEEINKQEQINKKINPKSYEINTKTLNNEGSIPPQIVPTVKTVPNVKNNQ